MQAFSPIMCVMTHTPQFAMVDPKLVTASPWNANVVSHENEEKLRASIERHGMFKPILVREIEEAIGDHVIGVTLQCIGGWHRCEQAIELGYTEVPAINLGPISDEQAKEISLADNARYGIDDTLKLSELLGDLDTSMLENILPWTNRDIAALTASLSVDIDNLDLDEPNIPDIADEDEPAERTKPTKTHQNLTFRNSINDAARIAALIKKTQEEQGFTSEDDKTNAGEALAYLLLNGGDDADAVS